MKKMLKYMPIIATASVILLTGCSAKDALKTIVSKTYGTISQIEYYVGTVDSEEIIDRVKTIKTPLTIISTALDFISNRIKDEEITNTLKTVSLNIGKIVSLVDSTDQEDLDLIKTEMLDALTKGKDALAKVAKLIGADIPSNTHIVSVTKDLGKSDLIMANIIIDAEEISAIIKTYTKEEKTRKVEKECPNGCTH